MHSVQVRWLLSSDGLSKEERENLLVLMKQRRKAASDLAEDQTIVEQLRAEGF